MTAPEIGTQGGDDKWRAPEVAEMISHLEDLRQQMEGFETRFDSELRQLPESQRASARNLLHYVALRRNDLRDLQEQLVGWGLSSLGRCEAYVMANVRSVLDILRRLSRAHPELTSAADDDLDYARSRELLEIRTMRLFGEKPEERGAHIMVTMPSEAAHDYDLVRDLLEGGMNCMRINCAHDDRAAWGAMIENLRRAEEELGRRCRVIMDLAGPKLRTGPIEPGPRVVAWRPRRDRFGRVVQPARIWLFPASAYASPPAPADASLPVEGDWLEHAETGDHLRFRDARGRLRIVRLVEWTPQGVWAECQRTAYVTPQTELWHAFQGETAAARRFGTIGGMPPLEQALVLKTGDPLVLTAADQIGRPAAYDDRGQLLQPAMVGCTLPSIFRDVRKDERILFDDGKIQGVIRQVHADHLVVEITRARPRGERLRADKGINLPDSELQLDALTPKDRHDLEFIVEHADLVAYSFVRRAEDVEHLLEELNRLNSQDVGVVLKIENRQACERLARILLAVMHGPTAGVMIARGDLMVECGWQRMAELQEQILWMCEAAHMPVVWATQVLEGLAKRGLPSRAEVTDAAMGVRAECVMLNKGPHIVDALRTLDDILRRMQDHQLKKRPLLRRLRLADDLRPLKE